MDLARYVEEVRHQLMIAADAGGDDARALAERLAAPLEATTRLVLLDALSTAADEITTDLAPGSVDVRLRGLDPEFVVTSPPVDLPLDAPHHDVTPAAGGRTPAAPVIGDADEGGTARITLRLPEHLKNQIELAAGRDGLSVNAWLVRATAAALEPAPVERSAPRRTAIGGQHVTGWAR